MSRVQAPARPGVIVWYNVYVVVMTLMYLCIVVLGIVAIGFADDLANNAQDRVEVLLMGAMYAGLSGVCMIVFGLGLVFRRGKLGWIYGIVLIGFGMTSGCCLPFTIPLLIFWIKPEVKKYFGA